MEPRASFDSVIVLPRRRKRTAAVPSLEYETSDRLHDDDDDDDTTVSSSTTANGPQQPYYHLCLQILENKALLLATVVASGVGTWFCLQRMFQILSPHTVNTMTSLLYIPMAFSLSWLRHHHPRSISSSATIVTAASRVASASRLVWLRNLAVLGMLDGCAVTAVWTASTDIPTVGLLLVPIASSIPLALSLGRRRRPWWHWVGGAGALGLGGCLWSWGRLWLAVYGVGDTTAEDASFCQPTSDAADNTANNTEWCHELATKATCRTVATCEWNEEASEKATAAAATVVAVHLLLLVTSAIPLTLSAFGKRRLVQKYRQQQPRYAAGWMSVFQCLTAVAWSWSSTATEQWWPVSFTSLFLVLLWAFCQAFYTWGMERLVPHRTTRLFALMGVLVVAPVVLTLFDSTGTTVVPSDGLAWSLILVGLWVHRRAQTKGDDPTHAAGANGPMTMIHGTVQEMGIEDDCMDDDDDESSVGSWGDYFLGSFGPVEHQTSYALVRGEQPLLPPQQTGDV